MASENPLDVVYVSAGCNLTPRALDWLSLNNVIAYASHSSIYLYKPEPSGAGGKVVQTLNGHKGRVNAVKWLSNGENGKNTASVLVTASSDSTVKVWSDAKGKFDETSSLKGHTGAVNDVSGIFMSKTAVVASASSDSTIMIWKGTDLGDNFFLVELLNLKNSLCVALELTAHGGFGSDTALLAFSTENHAIQLYSVAIRQETGTTTKLATLTGHEDWVRGLSFTNVSSSSDIFMASSSQDTSVRVWKISKDSNSTAHGSTGEFQMEKKSFSVESQSYNVTLETVLLGHEGWVYVAKWFPSSSSSNLQLMTFSFDHTIILWSPDDESGVWFENIRLGNVGGEALGFLGGAIGPMGLSVVAHTHQGSLKYWSLNPEDGRWCPRPICGGHFGGVNDIAWEPNGHYLLSVSADQTTRLHAQWVAPTDEESLWYEMARPQIHGHSMNSIAALPNFTFVSAADEKVFRAFVAPRNTLENLQNLSQVVVSDEVIAKSSEPMGATVPALGLSNKAVFSDESETNPNRKGQNDDDTSYFSRQLLREPPTDDFLSQNSLWPETKKLYGHGYDVYRVAASHNGRFVASACKASSVEHANIILWHTRTWERVHDFEGTGHSLTITEMSFSKDDVYLLSVSRDRNWVVHCCEDGSSNYRLLARSDKKTGVHSRIIWTCGWSHDSEYFATSSRDGVWAVWSSNHLVTARKQGDIAVATTDWTAVKEKMSNGSATAISFAPSFLPGDVVKYLLATGTESGCVQLVSFEPTNKSCQALYSFENIHSATISRILFRPVHPDKTKEELQLASSSLDHSVKIFTVRPSLFVA